MTSQNPEGIRACTAGPVEIRRYHQRKREKKEIHRETRNRKEEKTERNQKEKWKFDQENRCTDGGASFQRSDATNDKDRSKRATTLTPF